MNQDNKIVIPAAVIILLITLAAVYATQVKSNNPVQSVPSAVNAPKPVAVSTKYKDGKYEATGTYSTPEGAEQVGVILTIKNDVITDSQIIEQGKDATSKRFQNDFASNYKPIVIGKNISTLSLDKVSGSSLTPKGFNNALEQIRNRAQNNVRGDRNTLDS